MMDVIRGISFNHIYFNFCLLTTDTLGYDYFLLDLQYATNKAEKNDLIKSLTINGQSSYIESKLDKELL